MIPRIILLFLAVPFVSFAQQDPINTQYISNPLALNPSYAGINNVTNFSLNWRNQWSSIKEGSPTTYTFTGNTSLVNGKVGLGLMVLNDQIGISNNTEVQVSYAYKISNQTSSFSFGLQTGFTRFSSNLDLITINPNSDDDPLFQPGVEEATKFNVGAGVTFMNDNLYLSLSVPRMLNTKVGDSNEVTIYERHFYFVGQYLFDLKPGFKMKPSILARGVMGAPLSIDVNVNFLINNFIWAGAFTRNFKTYGAMVQFDFLEAYKIGYSYEFLNTSLSDNNLMTHEVILSADLAIFSHQEVYRRFF